MAAEAGAHAAAQLREQTPRGQREAWARRAGGARGSSALGARAPARSWPWPEGHRLAGRPRGGARAERWGPTSQRPNVPTPGPRPWVARRGARRAVAGRGLRPNGAPRWDVGWDAVWQPNSALRPNRPNRPNQKGQETNQKCCEGGPPSQRQAFVFWWVSPGRLGQMGRRAEFGCQTASQRPLGVGTVVRLGRWARGVGTRSRVGGLEVGTRSWVERLEVGTLGRRAEFGCQTASQPPRVGT